MGGIKQALFSAGVAPLGACRFKRKSGTCLPCSELLERILEFKEQPMNQICFKLKPVPPFRLDLTVWVLRRRADNLWDRWDGITYQRLLALKENALEITVTQNGPPADPELTITAAGVGKKSDLKAMATANLKRMLGLQIDLKEFYSRSGLDDTLNPLVQKFVGLKPPLYPTVYEALVNAITCQQFTLTAGIRLLNRLVTNWGITLKGKENSPHAFPRPADLAGLEVEALRELGFSRQKALALISLSRKIVDGELDLEELTSLSDASAMQSLTELRGVGRWTAEYVLLRALGRVHIFPGDDVGVRNHLQRWLNLEGPMDYESVQRTLSRWEPYGGLIYFHLLLNNLGI